MSSFRFRDGRGLSPDFSLVLPAYNPGPRLAQTLHDLANFAQGSSEVWEFVIVCDGCTDGSADLVRNCSFVRLISYTPNRGKGYAVRQGLLAASAPHRIFTDIDLAYSFDDIRRVARALRGGAEVAIASRTHPESTILLPANLLGYAYRRNLQSKVFATLVRAMLPIAQRDTQAGLKGLSERVVREIVPRMTCHGFGFDCELLTGCVRSGIPISEIPVTVRCDSAGSTTNARSTLKMVKELWRIRKAWPAVAVNAGADASGSDARLREAG